MFSFVLYVYRHLTSKSPRSSGLPMYCRISLREQVLFRKYANPPVMPLAFYLSEGDKHKKQRESFATCKTECQQGLSI